MQPKASVHFEGINSLRCIAALMIVVFHALGGPAMQSPFQNFCHNLSVGVDFFFIISGFLITYLLLEEKANIGRVNIPAFYIRRILRIFPLYYLLIIISFLAFAPTDRDINYLPQLYFWGNFDTIKNQDWPKGWLHPLWTICVEEHFYWVVPLLLALLPVRAIKYLYGIIILLSITIRGYYFLHYPANWYLFNCHTFSKMDVIAIGGLLACIHFEYPIKVRSNIILIIVLVLIMILQMSFIDFFNYSSFFNAMFIKYLVNIPFAVFFMLYIFSNHPWVTTFKTSGKLNYLGNISYGIYMLHSIATYYVGKWIPAHNFNEKFLLVLPAIALTILPAALSYRYIESPFLRLKNRFELIRTRAQ